MENGGHLNTSVKIPQQRIKRIMKNNIKIINNHVLQYITFRLSLLAMKSFKIKAIKTYICNTRDTFVNKHHYVHKHNQ